MSDCTVYLPGLAGPYSAALHGADCPALAALLRGARRRAVPLDAWPQRLAGHFGCAVAPLAAAGWRAECGESGGDVPVLRADPVHLRVDRDCARLFAAPLLQIHSAEAAALAETLAAHLVGDGLELRVAAPQRWYLRGAALAGLRSTPLAAASGRSVVELLPQSVDGTAARHWQRLHTELQMLLHQHPVNTAREARGEPAVNSLWLWGEGALPAPRADIAVAASGDGQAGELAWLRGLGAAPGDLRTAPAAGQLIVADQRLLDALQRADPSAWRDALVDIEHRLLAPLAQHWRAARIGRLQIDAGALHFCAARHWWQRLGRGADPARALHHRPAAGH